jgi:hypothetical protein
MEIRVAGSEDPSIEDSIGQLVKIAVIGRKAGNDKARPTPSQSSSQMAVVLAHSFPGTPVANQGVTEALRDEKGQRPGRPSPLAALPPWERTS